MFFKYHDTTGNLEALAAHIGYFIQDLWKLRNWREYPVDVFHHLLGFFVPFLKLTNSRNIFGSTRIKITSEAFIGSVVLFI